MSSETQTEALRLSKIYGVNPRVCEIILLYGINMALDKALREITERRK